MSHPVLLQSIKTFNLPGIGGSFCADAVKNKSIAVKAAIMLFLMVSGYVVNGLEGFPGDGTNKL